jgi:hypothetical protein
MTDRKPAPDAQDKAEQKSLRESFNGLQNFRPADLEKGSYAGLEKLRPQASTALPAESPTPSGSDAVPETKPAEQ